MSLIWFEICVIKVTTNRACSRSTKSFVCTGNIQKKNTTIQKQSISGSDCGNRQVKIATMEIQQATQIDVFRAFGFLSREEFKKQSTKKLHFGNLVFEASKLVDQTNNSKCRTVEVSK
jgi:hypothetical protein